MNRLPSKAARELVRELARDGWHVDSTRSSGHLLLVHTPTGARIIVSSTPSDRRIAHRVRQSARQAIREAQEG